MIPHHNRVGGFSLVELAVVLAIVVFLTVFLLPTASVGLSNKNRLETLQKLKNVETAIYNFAIVNKRLPCPADGTLTAGTEVRNGSGDCTSNQAYGVVPWTTLGIAFADIQDSWNNQLTYRIGYGLARTTALDMSSCDPAGTATTSPAPTGSPSINLGLCASTCTGTFAAANCTSPQNFLLRKGLDVSNGTTKIMDYTAYTGAAFVIISHGENGYGAINNSRIYQDTAKNAIAGTTLEAPNINAPAPATLVVTSGAPPQFVDATFSDANDGGGTASYATTYFDDLMIRPTLMYVINLIQLGPRSH